MAGPDELHTKDSTLATLIERVDGMRQAIISLTNETSQVKDAVYKADTARATDYERLVAKSETNLATIEVLRLVGVSNREAIKAEEDARIGGDKDAKTEHKADMAALTSKIEKLTDAVDSLKINNRLMVIASGFLSSVAVIYVAGHLLRLFP